MAEADAGDVGAEPRSSRWLLFTGIWRSTAILVVLTGAYYLLPAGSPVESTRASWSTGGVGLGLLVVAAVIRNQIMGRHRKPRILVVAEGLLTVLYLTIMVFAVTYHRIAVSTDQISGLLDKTDGLYFTVTIMSTVGFGDIHATGAVARGVVTAHMLFNAIYIGTALRLLSKRAATVMTQDDDESEEGTPPS